MLLCLVHEFFGIATSAADIPADNPDGNKTLSAKGVSTVFINCKPAVVNGLRKVKNPPSWLVIFLVVLLNKIPLFSKDLITFIICFISLFVVNRIIPEPVNDEFFKIFYQVN